MSFLEKEFCFTSLLKLCRHNKLDKDRFHRCMEAYGVCKNAQEPPRHCVEFLNKSYSLVFILTLNF